MPCWQRDEVPQATKAAELIRLALETEEDQVFDLIASKRDTEKVKFVSIKSMGVNFEILYHPLVIKEDILKISTADKNNIKKAIENKLAISPEIFGKPLRRSLKGYRKLRVGDYRVIYRIEGKS